MKPSLGLLTASMIGVGLAGAGLAFHPAPRLVWNASASTPIGLYWVAPDRRPSVGEIVVFRPPRAYAAYMASRGYLPIGVPLVKTIAAGPGQTVCRAGDQVTVDRAPVARALERDHLGRPLPAWRGCVHLGEGQVLLLNRSVPDSLDGRYFGPASARDIIGRAYPIWIRKGA